LVTGYLSPIPWPVCRTDHSTCIHLHVISSSGCAFQLIYEGPDQLPFTEDDRVTNFPPDLKFE
jgi:hypothetical protein